TSRRRASDDPKTSQIEAVLVHLEDERAGEAVTTFDIPVPPLRQQFIALREITGRAGDQEGSNRVSSSARNRDYVIDMIVGSESPTAVSALPSLPPIEPSDVSGRHQTGINPLQSGAPSPDLFSGTLPVASNPFSGVLRVSRLPLFKSLGYPLQVLLPIPPAVGSCLLLVPRGRFVVPHVGRVLLEPLFKLQGLPFLSADIAASQPVSDLLEIGPADVAHGVPRHQMARVSPTGSRSGPRIQVE